MQRFPARCNDADVGRSTQHRERELGRGFDEVLAVVEDQQRPLGAQMGAKRLQRRASRICLNAEDLHRLGNDQSLLAKRLKVDEPGAIRKQVD